jgi:hypothetical protein
MNLMKTRHPSFNKTQKQPHFNNYTFCKPEGKRPLGRPIRRWVDNIKMDLKKRGWGGMYLIDLAEYRVQWRALVNTVNEPSGFIKCWEILE